MPQEAWVSEFRLRNQVCVSGGGRVKASVSKSGFHEGILVCPSRAAVSCSRMQPFLSAVLTCAAPQTISSCPSVSIPPPPLGFCPVSIHPVCSVPSAPACSLFPSLQLSAHLCPCLCHSCASVSIHESFCLSSAGPQPQDPAAAVLLSAP